MWLNEKVQEEMNHFKYLGSLQTTDGTSVKEVKIRLVKAHKDVTRLAVSQENNPLKFVFTNFSTTTVKFSAKFYRLGGSQIHTKSPNYIGFG